MCIHVHVAYSPMSILQGMLNLYPCRRVYPPMSMLQGKLTCIHVAGYTHLYACRRVYSPVSVLQGILTYVHVAGYTHLYPCCRVYSPISISQGILTCIHVSGYTHLYPCCRVYSTMSMLQGILTCIHVAGYTYLYPCRKVYSPVSMLQGVLYISVHGCSTYAQRISMSQGILTYVQRCRVYSTYLYTAAAREKLKDPSTQKLHEQVVRAVNAYKECFKKYPVRVCVYNRTLTRLHPVSTLTFLPR